VQVTVRYEPGILVVMRGLAFVSLAALALAACTLDLDKTP